MKRKIIKRLITIALVSFFAIHVANFTFADDPPPTPPGGSSGAGGGTGGSDITRNGATGAPIDRKTGALVLVLVFSACFGVYMLYPWGKETTNP